MARVALLGFGTVGSAVAHRLASPPLASSLQLTHIFDRRASWKRERAPFPSPPVDRNPVWTDTLPDVLESDADIVVEAVGGLEAAEWMRAALLSGKSVVTANKQAVAKHGPELSKLAERQGRQFRFEAAVGGAMPIVRTIAEGLAGERIDRIDAILNGTTNAVLSTMDVEGCSLEDALGQARARGYAEGDPSRDLDGDDARAKLAILCGLAFGIRVDPHRIPARSAFGLTPVSLRDARRRGSTIRQLAHAAFDHGRRSLDAWVSPLEVPRDSLWGRTVGAGNAALVAGAHCGEIALSGSGAGGPQTASAIVADVLTIARDRAAVVPAPSLSTDFSWASIEVPCLSFLFAEAV